MTVDTKKLRELAEAASPGPWRNGADPSHFDAPEVTDGKTFAYYVPTDHDAAFIAAANPLTVIALLDEIERLRAPKVLTEAQIVGALAQGRVERKCAEGDHAWISLLERNETLRTQLAAMTAARDEACNLVSDCLDRMTGLSNDVTDEPGFIAAESKLAELRKVGAP